MKLWRRANLILAMLKSGLNRVVVAPTEWAARKARQSRMEDL
jgi:hypothetical protein